MNVDQLPPRPDGLTLTVEEAPERVVITLRDPARRRRRSLTHDLEILIAILLGGLFVTLPALAVAGVPVGWAPESLQNVPLDRLDAVELPPLVVLAFVIAATGILTALIVAGARLADHWLNRDQFLITREGWSMCRGVRLPGRARAFRPGEVDAIGRAPELVVAVRGRRLWRLTAYGSEAERCWLVRVLRQASGLPATQPLGTPAPPPGWLVESLAEGGIRIIPPARREWWQVVLGVFFTIAGMSIAAMGAYDLISSVTGEISAPIVAALSSLLMLVLGLFCGVAGAFGSVAYIARPGELHLCERVGTWRHTTKLSWEDCRLQRVFQTRTPWRRALWVRPSDENMTREIHSGEAAEVDALAALISRETGWPVADEGL